MKSLMLTGLILFPIFVFSQAIDTAEIEHKVDSMILVSQSHAGQGHFDEAFEVINLAEKIVLEKVGSQSVAYGNVCFSYGGTLCTKGDYAEAEKWCMKAKSIREEVLGKEHLDYVKSLNGLADVYFKINDYDRAEPLYLEAKAIMEKMEGSDNPVYAKSLTALASIHRDKGNYDKVEPLYLKAKEIIEKVYGKDDLHYASSLTYLTIYYYIKGEFEKAENSGREALEIYANKSGENSLGFGLANFHLGYVYMCKNEYDKAEPLLIKSKEIYQRILGNEHIDYAWILHGVAKLLKAKGDYEKATDLVLEAKEIWRKVGGEEHPGYALSIEDLAVLYSDMGEYDKAKFYHLEARRIWEETVGKENPDCVRTLKHLANLNSITGNFVEAEKYFLQYNTSINSYLQKTSTYSSEKEMLLYGSHYQKDFENFYCFTQEHPTGSLRSAAYDNALSLNYALLFNAIIREKGIAHAGPETRNVYSEWKSCHAQLSKQYALPLEKTDAALVAKLESKANDLEKELARRSLDFADSRQDVYWYDVQDKLKSGEVAIEFIHYGARGPNQAFDTIYAALLLRPGDAAPLFITLFELREMAALLNGANGKNYRRINELYLPGDENSLYKLLWQPLEAYLQGVTTINCSPSGLLHRLNLGAVALNEKETVGQRFELIRLGSTRRLVVPDRFEAAGLNTAYVIGGVRYESDSTALDDSFADTAFLPEENYAFHLENSVRGGAMKYLPHSAEEALDISHLLQSSRMITQLDTGQYATEERFRSLGNNGWSPRIIHIATHGFFLPDPKESGSNSSSPSGEDQVIFRLSENPMLRSGLLLAGANQAWTTGNPPEGREDGILTAYEISQMNLSNTELVVLSACETGLGDIEGNEGVYGLQRAFKIAGAKYLIMSLWSVPDKSSRELMTDFYDQWLNNGLTIPEAFRKAQNNMQKKHPKFPFNWAGFVLVE